MKVKLLTLLAVISLLGNVSSAQGVGAYKAKKTEVVKVKNKNLVPQRQGFFIMPEIEVGGISRNGLDGGYQYKINAIFGYEFNNHFSLGVGTGFNNGARKTFIMISMKKDWVGTGFNNGARKTLFYHYGTFMAKMSNLPLYINIHGDIFKAKTSLYYSLDLGFMLPLKKAYYNDNDNINIDSNYYECYYKGIIISPELGVRINNCYLGINCLIANTYKNYVFPHWYVEDKFKEFIFSIKFGYKIPLNIGR